MTQNKITSNVEVTEEMIAAWKKKYGDVYIVSSEGRTAYLRRPDRKVLGAAGVIGGPDLLKQKEYMMRSCWLGGDETLLEEDKFFFGLSGQVDAMIEVATVELKKA